MTKYIAVAIIASVIVILAIEFFNKGLRYDVVFKHLTPLGYVLMFGGIWLFSAIFSGFISLFFKLAYITIENGHVSGRNYWGRKVRIPLDRIKLLDKFSDNGINAIVVNAGSFGKIFVYKHTEKFEEIIKLLQSHLPIEMDA